MNFDEDYYLEIIDDFNMKARLWNVLCELGVTDYWMACMERGRND